MQQATCTADLQWNRVLSLEPYSTEFKTLPLGHCGLLQCILGIICLQKVDEETHSSIRPYKNECETCSSGTHSVASAFNLYVGAQRIESNARDTARFKKKMDVLFDTVNSRTLKHHKREFCAILESHARERTCLILATSWNERMDADAPTEPIDDAAVCANLRKQANQIKGMTNRINAVSRSEIYLPHDVATHQGLLKNMGQWQQELELLKEQVTELCCPVVNCAYHNVNVIKNQVTRPLSEISEEAVNSKNQVTSELLIPAKMRCLLPKLMSEN
ncbi:hypothetical protein AVEN_77573-1 [Araneus ventricosus]|uniref:Uncharacterized protein n=1 Tax=Araneus ventricosus TaxID=182803 RepID=A0A4Y2UM54_ARAVE|nr:hypothetical protein AVEN_77573-1 [Araneus ventricosus]